METKTSLLPAHQDVGPSAGPQPLGGNGAFLVAQRHTPQAGTWALPGPKAFGSRVNLQFETRDVEPV